MGKQFELQLLICITHSVSSLAIQINRGCLFLPFFNITSQNRNWQQINYLKYNSVSWPPSVSSSVSFLLIISHPGVWDLTGICGREEEFMTIYTTGGSNPQCWMVKTILAGDTTVKLTIYSLPSDCAIHCLISPARQLINLISTRKSI